MGLDPKVRNLFIFLFKNLVVPLIPIVLLIKYIGVTDYFRLFGILTLALLVWKVGYTFYQRCILPAKKPQEFGKWAIVTGKTYSIRLFYLSLLIMFLLQFSTSLLVSQDPPLVLAKALLITLAN
jgi:hypothetical protein